MDGRQANRRQRAVWWDALRQDLRLATRGLRREPAFAIAVIGTLGLGIGANSAIFGIADRLLLQAPAQVAKPDEVSHLFSASSKADGGSPNIYNYPFYVELRRAVPQFRQLAAYSPVAAPVGQGTDAWSASAGLVTTNYFNVLGVRPARGRFFVESEEAPGATDLGVILSYDVWKTRFGQSETVLGQRLQIRGHSYPIVGVAPAGFSGLDLQGVDLWLPITAASLGLFAPDWRENAGDWWLNLVVRFPESPASARALTEGTTVLQRWVRDGWRHDSTQTARLALAPIAGSRGEGPRLSLDARIAAILAAVAGIVLVIACANIANLLVMRGFRKRREFAIRRALGITGLRLIAQMLVESLLLAALAGATALMLTEWIGVPLRKLLLPDVSWDRGPVDWRVAGITALAVLFAGLVTGLAPALLLRRTDLTAELKSGGRGTSMPRSRLQRILVFVQTGLTALLLVGAGVFLKSLVKVRALRLGFDADRVVIATVSFPEDVAAEQIRAFYERALERVRVVPGVERASLGQSDPFGWSFGTSVRIPGRNALPTLPSGGPYASGITADYLATLGTRLMAGRAFSSADRSGSAPVAIINETMARLFWPGESAVGKCFVAGDSKNCLEIVGIVEDARQYGIAGDPRLFFYMPLDQEGFGYPRLNLFVRTAGTAEDMSGVLRAALLELSPSLPYAKIQSIQSRVDRQTRPWHLGAIVLAAMGALALLVSAVGLYSIVAYGVTQRRQEMGIRMALGARPGELVRMVLATGARMTVLGLGAGCGAALILGRSLRDLLFQTRPNDWGVFAAVVLVLGAVALMASLIPAWRAGQLSPGDVLRVE
jgi:predicted permease